jgi:hypothetical protein
MPKNSNKTNNKINKIKTTIKNKTQKLANTIKRLRKQVNNTKKMPNKKFIPAANTKNMNKDFRILYQDGTTVKVTGRDLVYAIPDNLAQQNQTDIITVIPANPCYWLGTRISALAQGYQNYRPLSMKFSYIPQCAVTQQGNVIAGTLWNQAPSNDNLQQSLRTSNGGQLSQCYKAFTSNVRLKSNLQYNLYKTAGQFDQESNPFIFMSIAVGCKNSNNQNIIPGYYYVTWAFLLKNPIGNTNIFYNSGITTYAQVDKDYENKTIVFLTPGDEEIQRGAILQLEDDDEDQMVAYYNGSVYDMQETDLVWFFGNSTIQQSNALAKTTKQILNYEYITGEPESPQLDTTMLIFEPVTNPNVYRIWIPATHNAQPLSIQTSNMLANGLITRLTPLYFWNDPYYQNIGVHVYMGNFRAIVDNPGTYDKILEYEVSKDEVELVDFKNPEVNRNKKVQRRRNLNKSKFMLSSKSANNIFPIKPQQIQQLQDQKVEQQKLSLNNIEAPIINKIRQASKSKSRSKSKHKTFTNQIIEEENLDSSLDKLFS